MLKKIFSQEGFLWKGLNVLTDIIFLSTLWFLLCLLVVPIGPATTALYDAVIHGIRRREPVVYPRFFKTLKTEFKTAFLSGLLWGVLILVCVLTVRYLLALGETSRSAFAAGIAYYVVLIIPLGSACWVFPILSRFTYGWKDLNLTALKLSVGYLPRTVVLVLLTAEVGLLCIRYFFPAFFAPACMMLLWSLFIEPVFTKLGGGLKKESAAPEEDPSEDDTTESH